MISLHLVFLALATLYVVDLATTSSVYALECTVQGSQDLLYSPPPVSLCSHPASLYFCNGTFTSCLTTKDKAGAGCSQLIDYCLPQFLRCLNDALLKQDPSKSELCPWASKTRAALVASILDPVESNFPSTSLASSCNHVSCSIQSVHNSSCFGFTGSAFPDPCGRLQYRSDTLTLSHPSTATVKLTESPMRTSITQTVPIGATVEPTPAPPYNFSSYLQSMFSAEAVLLVKVSEALASINPVLPVLPGCPVWFEHLNPSQTISARVDHLFLVALSPEEQGKLVPFPVGSDADSHEGASNHMVERSTSSAESGSPLTTTTTTSVPPSPAPTALMATVGYLTRTALSSLIESVLRDYSVNLRVTDDILFELQKKKDTGAFDVETEAALNGTERVMLASAVVTTAASVAYGGCMVTQQPPTPPPTPHPMFSTNASVGTTIASSTVDPVTAVPSSTVPVPSTEPPVQDSTLAPAQRIAFKMKIKNLPAEPFIESEFKIELCAATVYDCYTNELVLVYQGAVTEGSPVYLQVEFKGVRAAELQQRASGISSGSSVLLAMGVLTVQAAPVVTVTESPSLLERSTSLLWIAGAGCLGGAVLIGGCVWWVRDRAARKRQYQSRFTGYEEPTEVPMLQVPDRGNRV